MRTSIHRLVAAVTLACAPVLASAQGLILGVLAGEAGVPDIQSIPEHVAKFLYFGAFQFFEGLNLLAKLFRLGVHGSDAEVCLRLCSCFGACRIIPQGS